MADQAGMSRRDVLRLAMTAATVATVQGPALAGITRSAAGSEATQWTYAGETGPDRWGALDPAFTACARGRGQSPIDLSGFIRASLLPITFRDGGAVSEIAHLGHTLQADFMEGSGIAVSGRTFALRQVHFHAPSEHHIDGRSFAMEAHLVHRDDHGNLAVVAVMLSEGRRNAALARLWAKLPERPGERARLSVPMKASELLPKRREYYRYAGSLTTPPCSEGVLWLVLKDPVPVSSEQVAAFKGVLEEPNNRPLQPLNARAVLR